jgi:hypothetical protein
MIVPVHLAGKMGDNGSYTVNCINEAVTPVCRRKDAVKAAAPEFILLRWLAGYHVGCGDA